MTRRKRSASRNWTPESFLRALDTGRDFTPKELVRAVEQIEKAGELSDELISRAIKCVERNMARTQLQLQIEEGKECGDPRHAKALRTRKDSGTKIRSAVQRIIAAAARPGRTRP